MKLELGGKVVLVGGSTRGIGRAIAATFVTEGAHVMVTGRHAPRVDATVTDLSAGSPNCVSGRTLDLTTTAGCQEAVAATVERWGRLDVTIANVGTGGGTRGWEASDEEWATVVEQNLYSASRLVRAAIPHMVAVGGGTIIMISSIAGVEALEAPIPYSVAKAGIQVMARNLARSLAQSGVRVNAVAPGNVLSPGGSWEERMTRDSEAVERYIKREVPLGRFGRPEEIADVVVFLASDRAAFITGTCVVADGGQTHVY